MQTNKEILIVPIDEFGIAVATELQSQSLWISFALAEWEQVAEQWDAWNCITTIVVSSRPTPVIDEQTNKHVFRLGGNFLRVRLDSFRLRIGPVVGPGHGVCWQCCMLRERQHSAAPMFSEAREQFYRHASQCVAGWIPAAAELAAYRVSGLLDKLARDIPCHGEFWEINLLTSAVQSGHALGVDGCPMCGLQIPPAERTTGHLAAALEWLWEEAPLS